MKTKLVFTIVILMTAVTMARQIPPFQGWERLKEMSSCIVIARCGMPIPQSGPVMNGPNSDYSIEVISVIKGANGTNAARLWTDHGLERGENYLIFGNYDSGIYQAFETYRVIPLGKDFSKSLIAQKSSDDQLQVLFKLRIAHLDQEIQNAEAERQRLEEGLEK
jgi:hypothetical protein